ncbi:MAG: exodeoxyribonuclease V subunit alpha [Betaproteobacteria bacterium]
MTAATMAMSIPAGNAAPPAETLARGFADRVVRWAVERGATGNTLNALRTAAYKTSLATTAGHVCIYLRDIDGPAAVADFDDAAWRTALLGSSMVGTPEAPGTLPLILDDEGRLYLHRYFDYERRLARRLSLLKGNERRMIGENTMRLLDSLFPGTAARADSSPDWQKLAGALALTRHLTIISGGPGTGKTTTVVNLLACILEQDPACRIKLAAPTGKAAARMLEAIRQQAVRLPLELKARLPSESFTVHRLLGVLPDSGEFRHGTDNPLPIDLLVIDEASMLDLALATRLFEAVPQSASIILLGDKDQLSAVESGAVFSELSADPTLNVKCIERLAALTGIDSRRIQCAPPATPSTLQDSVIWFTRNFRFATESGIGRLAAYINAGDAAGATEWLRSGVDPAVRWIEDTGPTLDENSMLRIVQGDAGYLDAARADLDDKAVLFAAFARFRVLCAEREGPRGVEGINRFASQHFRRALDHPLDPGSRSEWYPGRPVMILRNDYLLRLFNGDTGLVLPDESGNLMVYFPDNAGGFRAVPPVRLPAHETAFATTVHKAQGSEFQNVLLVLPAVPTRVVTRELLYTAVTRSREGATIISGAEVLEKAIASPTRRYSGLIERLREVGGRAT